MELTDEDVADILALLDSLPYDELDLRTARFRLTLRRSPDGWVQSRQVFPPDTDQSHPPGPAPPSPPPPPAPPPPTPPPPPAPDISDLSLIAVRAPLPGTFYRAPRPGAAPFVEVGSRVSEESVVGIVETMKLMNPVHAGTRGQVAEIPAGNGELVEDGSVLVRVLADPG